MGCDIHVAAQRRDDTGKWQTMPLNIFDWRSYALFGFLADVRNYSAVAPLAERRGYPADFVSPEDDGSREYWGAEHSFSWLSIDELLAHDYDAPVEDRRVTREVAPGYFNGGITCDPGEGDLTTLREFLGAAYFQDLETMKAAGVERIVFGFDS